MRTPATYSIRSEEHTSELQLPCNLVCRLLLEKKNKKKRIAAHPHGQHREGHGRLRAACCTTRVVEHTLHGQPSELLPQNRRVFFFFFLMMRRPPKPTLFPNPPLFR